MAKAKANARKLDIRFESDIDPLPSAAGKPRRASPASGDAKGRIWEFAAIATIPLVLVLGNSMLVPILPQMQRELGISQFQSSLVITLFSVSAGIFIPVIGYLSDRFSRKAVMIPSLILYGGAGILAGLGAVWHSYGVLIAARASTDDPGPAPARAPSTCGIRSGAHNEWLFIHPRAGRPRRDQQGSRSRWLQRWRSPRSRPPQVAGS